VIDRLSEIWDKLLYDVKPAMVLIVVIVAAIVSRIAHFIIRRVIRRLAHRSVLLPLSQGAWWRSRDSRVDAGDVEARRRQRIDAATRMIGHMASIVIWLVAVIVVIHVLDVSDPASYVSSAGFIGAAIAIGGQHKVNDYITGLSVHFEDRYGVGDEVEIHIGQGGEPPIVAVVDHIGLFSTRVRDARSTLHFPNSALAVVRNLSQEAAVSTLKLVLPSDVSADDARSSLRELAGTQGLTDVVFVGDLAVQRESTGEVELEVRTAKTLDDSSRSRLVRRAEALLERDGTE
jgi:small conductance mechanosensitive channel